MSALSTSAGAEMKPSGRKFEASREAASRVRADSLWLRQWNAPSSNFERRSLRDCREKSRADFRFDKLDFESKYQMVPAGGKRELLFRASLLFSAEQQLRTNSPSAP
jgi:hypothetical protein